MPTEVPAAPRRTAKRASSTIGLGPRTLNYNSTYKSEKFARKWATLLRSCALPIIGATMTKALLAFSHKVLKSTGLLGRAKRTALPLVNQTFFIELMEKTGGFAHTKWLGYPIWQNVMDLWTIQETIAEVKPSLLIETGTNQGGSALFYANLFDLLGNGRIITVDVQKLHSIHHDRIEFLIGSSISNEIVSKIKAAVASTSGPVMVILDSDHSRDHVRKELEAYAPCVTANSYILVQDGSTDDIPVLGRAHPPGPLYAIRDFLTAHNEFEIDRERCDRFVITQHTDGWLKKIANGDGHF